MTEITLQVGKDGSNKENARAPPLPFPSLPFPFEGGPRAFSLFEPHFHYFGKHILMEFSVADASPWWMG